MTMWLVIMYVTLTLTGGSLLYLSNRICKFSFMDKLSRQNKKRKAVLSLLLVFSCFFIIGLILNFMNAIVCVVYFAMIWFVVEMVCNVIRWSMGWYRQKFGFSDQKASFYLDGVIAIVCSLAALGCGWYLDYHVWQTEYTFYSDKLSQDIKVVAFADSHIGTTFHADGFAEHIAEMQKQNPDIVIVAGDFVDDDTSKEDMMASCWALGTLKTTYGVYFVFGNHDKGYYGAHYRGFSSDELVAELEKNGVKVLRDETVLIGDMLYLVGRRDFSVKKEQGGRVYLWKHWLSL